MIWCECLPYSQKLKKKKSSDLPGAKLLIERNVKVRASLTASTCQTTDSYHTGISLIAVCSRLCPLSVRGATEMYKSRKWAGESWGLLHANHWRRLSGDSPATDLPVPVQIQTGSLRFIHLFLLSLFFCCQTTLKKPLKQKTIVFCMNYSAFGGSPAEHSWQWSDKYLKTCSQIKMALNLTSDQWLTVYKHVKLQILSWGWCQWERHRVVEIKKKVYLHGTMNVPIIFF